jgi:hypothetical protein
VIVNIELNVFEWPGYDPELIPGRKPQAFEYHGRLLTNRRNAASTAGRVVQGWRQRPSGGEGGPGALGDSRGGSAGR